MKRIILLTTFIISILFSGMATAQEIEPCQGSSEIIIGTVRPLPAIQSSLTNYDESKLNNGNYCLVFNIQDAVSIRLDPLTLSIDVENFLRGHENHDVYIFGLELTAEPSVTLPLLTIINNTTNRVIITGLQMTNVKNGLKLGSSDPIENSGPIEVRGSMITGLGGDPTTRMGACIEALADNTRIISSTISNCGEGIRVTSNEVEVNDSEISGNATEGVHITGINSRITNTRIHNSPVCVSILGDGANVRSSTISNCGEGARIAADNVFLGAENPSTYETDKNTFIGNTTGIHQISGTGNKWPFNSISGGDGIVVVDGARPVIHREEGDIATLTCTQPEGATAIAACEMQFELLAELGGEVEVYKTDRRPPAEFQGRDYIARCAVSETNKCVFDASNASMLISNIMCGDARCDFTALQTGVDSSVYINSFKLKTVESTISAPSTPLPTGTFGATGGGAADGGEETPAVENPLGGGQSAVPIGTGGPISGPDGGSAGSATTSMKCNLTIGGTAGGFADALMFIVTIAGLLARRRLR